MQRPHCQIGAGVLTGTALIKVRGVGLRFPFHAVASACSAALALLLVADAASATPWRIIILRHGEKADDWRLCSAGELRAKALAAHFLGKDSAGSLFEGAEPPAAFLAITLHTLELAAPAAEAGTSRSSSTRSCPAKA